MKYPSLDHVASLAVGCLESGDKDDGSTVNLGWTTPQF